MATDNELLDSTDQIVVKLLTDALAANVPREDLHWDQREGVAEEFLEFVGRIAEFVSTQQPSSAKVAALMYFVGRLGLDKMDAKSSIIAVTLVEAMQQITKAAAEVRDQAAKKAEDGRVS